jgi:UDP-N-acetylglucosamine 1-carboxyvinyltransferase
MITHGALTLRASGIDTLLPSVFSVFQQIGAQIDVHEDRVVVSAPEAFCPCDITTEPFTGYPTDLQAQVMAVLSLAFGSSIIHETIWENRFMHVAELARMGADISVHGLTAIIRGVPELFGAPVMATDLRASFSLVLAGLAAKGETIVNRIYHLDRGYEAVPEKLAACGARIERIVAEK